MEMWYTHIHAHAHTHTRTHAHTHTHIPYTGILLRHKKKEILTFATTRMDIEVIILSEVSQRGKKILLNMLPYGMKSFIYALTQVPQFLQMSLSK